MNMNLNIKPSHDVCPTHKTKMALLGNRSFCKQCSKEALDLANKQHAQTVNAMVREKHFAGAMLPSRHAQAGFANYQVTNEGQKFAKAQCVAYVKNFVDAGQRNNLIMVGRTGTGKTHLGCAIAKNILNDWKFARYVTSADMANAIATAWTRSDDSETNAIYRFTEYDLLVLDEYGLHDRNEKILPLVHKVLYARYDAGKPTVLISNLTLKDLKEDLGDRLWSRLQEDNLVVVECNWADRRVGGVV